MIEGAPGMPKADPMPAGQGKQAIRAEKSLAKEGLTPYCHKVQQREGDRQHWQAAGAGPAL